MKRLVICAFVVIASLAAATTMLRSHAPVPGFASMQEFHAKAAVNKLPIEEYEDMSLVYSAAPTK